MSIFEDEAENGVDWGGADDKIGPEKDDEKAEKTNNTSSFLQSIDKQDKAKQIVFSRHFLYN